VSCRGVFPARQIYFGSGRGAANQERRKKGKKRKETATRVHEIDCNLGARLKEGSNGKRGRKGK